MTEIGSAAGTPVKGNLPPLIEAMTHPEFYPHRPRQVEFKQTHLSYVFLAGAYVYKVKKPVHFAFADCSTLALRYRFCGEELRLNRRLAPEVYLGVVPIIDDGGEFRLGDEGRSFEPKAQEYAVKMRRLPEERMLERLVREGRADGPLISALAQRLVAFHREASTARGWRHGSAAVLWRTVLGNLQESERFAGYTLTDRQFIAIKDYLKGFLAGHWELLNERARQGYVREGHGDLRCEHVCLSGAIQIFDCLEFSESLRYCDVASDIAFLAMDLDALGAPALADELIDAYSSYAGDETLATLTTFYKCHRACVRGKVESLKSLEDEVPSAERESARDRARASFSLAFRYASCGRPALVIVCGAAGTGKSTVARRLRDRTGFEVLNSDRIRKRLAGIAETDHVYTSYAAGIYSPDFDRLTYDTLVADARSSLRDGCGIIIDATFKRPEDRASALAIGAQRSIPVLFVECRADRDEVLRRLNARTAKGDSVSDATVEVYLHQLAEFPPLAQVPPGHHLVVDTTQPIEGALQRIECSLDCLFNPRDGVRPARHDS